MILQLQVIWELEEHTNWSHEITIGQTCMTTLHSMSTIALHALEPRREITSYMES